jgi:hypothetical protein
MPRREAGLLNPFPRLSNRRKYLRDVGRHAERMKSLQGFPDVLPRDSVTTAATNTWWFVNAAPISTPLLISSSLSVGLKSVASEKSRML